MSTLDEPLTVGTPLDLLDEREAREVRDAAEHRHDWKRTDDWDWGPGTTTYECFGCSGLRVVRPNQVLTAEEVAANSHRRRKEQSR